MNKDTLTLLGCSGSLAFVLLTTHAATAGTIAPQYAGYAGLRTTATSTANASLAQANSQFATLDPMSDTVGDLAIAKFGCDCVSCRNQVIQMIQSGRLALPR